MAAPEEDGMLTVYKVDMNMLKTGTADDVRASIGVMISLPIKVKKIKHETDWSFTTNPILLFMTRIWRTDDEYEKILNVMLEFFPLPQISSKSMMFEILAPLDMSFGIATPLISYSDIMSQNRLFVQYTHQRRKAFVTFIKAYVASGHVFTREEQFTILNYAVRLDKNMEKSGPLYYVAMNAYDQLTAPGMLDSEATNNEGQTVKQKSAVFYEKLAELDKLWKGL